MDKLPTFYIPHGGGPCFFMDWNPAGTWDGMARYLASFADDYRSDIKAIIVISAHWESQTIKVTGSRQPDLIYDYHGFPAHTYELKWPAPGAPELARQAVDMLSAGGITAELDRQRGYDHGVFIPFLLAFEQADIPTIQISLSADLSPETHLQMGKLLAPLRKEGVLIVGSGMSYHDVGALMGRKQIAGAAEFDTWLSESMLDIKGRETHLAGWADAPFARACHPREEHLLPLHIVAGAAMGEKAELSYHENVMGAAISAFKFG